MTYGQNGYIYEEPRISIDLVHSVRRGENGEHQPVDAERGLDHVRHVLLLARLVKVLHRLAARRRVLREVVVAARGAPLELLRAEREGEHDVGARARVVRELVLGVHVEREELLKRERKRIKSVGYGRNGVRHMGERGE